MPQAASPQNREETRRVLLDLQLYKKMSITHMYGLVTELDSHLLVDVKFNSILVIGVDSVQPK